LSEVLTIAANGRKKLSLNMRLALPVALIVFFVALVILLMSSIAEIRFLELGKKLSELTGKPEDFRSLSILKRLRLNYDAQFANDEARKFSEEMNLAVALTNSQDSSVEDTYSRRIGLRAVNLINSLLGLPHVNLSRPSREEKLIEGAFFFEKQRQFAKARSIYDDLTKQKLPRAWRDYVLIHRAFCSALTGAYGEATGNLEEVIRDGEDKSNRALAAEMLQIVHKQLEKSKRISEGTPWQQKVEYFHAIGAYAEAVSAARFVPRTQWDARLLYLYAHSLEETGNAEEAVQTYRTAIKSGGPTGSAVQANRRLYALGAYYGQGKALREEAVSNSRTVVNDTRFFSDSLPAEGMIESLERDLKRESSVAAAVVREETPALFASSTSAADKPVATPPAKPDLPIAAPKVSVPVLRAAPATPIDLSDLTNPLTARRAAKLSRNQKKELMLKAYAEIDRVATNDGNEFFGVIFGENAKKIYIFTLLGNLTLNKDDLTERSKVPIQNMMQ